MSDPTIKLRKNDRGSAKSREATSLNVEVGSRTFKIICAPGAKNLDKCFMN